MQAAWISTSPGKDLSVLHFGKKLLFNKKCLLTLIRFLIR